ncbi:unnamed protein product, partial [Mesorhabditis belari]|uniref:Uncharacterized protein n=1 Tax=Mesorhabditis belari TaxID=2138241 RepID=A0AAF3J2X9_9BILA
MLLFTITFAFLGLIVPFLITNFPDQRVNFNQYSGFYSVGVNGDCQLHYRFLEPQNSPRINPVANGRTRMFRLIHATHRVWTFLYFNALLALQANADEETLKSNLFAWNRNSSVLVFEAPAGVGFL